MKEIVISPTRELKKLFGAFIVASFTNLFSIIWYDSPWHELVTEWDFVAILSIAFYFIISVGWWIYQALRRF